MSLERALPLSFILLLASHTYAANLSYSAYLKDGFTPRSMVADAQGNLYLSGVMITDTAAGTTSAVVAKLNPQASAFLYFVYLDSAASDNVTGIAVDSAGNAYVTGSTSNPNFPTTGGTLATPPANAQDSRTFLTKLGPNGAIAFSILVGGSVASGANAITLTPEGQILLTGSASSGFPVTAGAYQASDGNGHPYLMEVDASGSSLIFSAFGIGGSSIALDPSGNIYVSGSTTLLDYPTTPGAYQTTFAPAYICGGLCQIGFAGNQQYLTKVNPAGSQLIYSTGINSTTAYRSTSTTNTGLAVDAVGNAYVTGVIDGGDYPFTVAPPANSPYEFGFLTKIDAAGANLLYSIPAGGGGVRVDSSGGVYLAGTVTSLYSGPGLTVPTNAVTPPASLSWLPSACLPNNLTGSGQTYAMQLDPTSGTVLDTQWIDGGALSAVAMTLASGKAWAVGTAQSASVVMTPGALTPAGLTLGNLVGTYLSGVDFTQSAGSGPQIACLLDAGNLLHSGPIAANQLLTIMGSNLGADTGVSVTFDGNLAQLLYSSPLQINLVVPATVSQAKSTVVQVTVNGAASATRQLPVIASNPELFADTSQATACNTGLAPLALNSDGSRNSCQNPAKLGSVISFFVHGNPPCLCFDAAFGEVSAPVVNVVSLTSYLTRVDVQLPNSYASASGYGSVEGDFQFTLRVNGAAVGPFPIEGGPLLVYGAQ